MSEIEQPLRLRAHPMAPGQQALGVALASLPIANSGQELVEKPPFGGGRTHMARLGKVGVPLPAHMFGPLVLRPAEFRRLRPNSLASCCGRHPHFGPAVG